MSGKSAKEAAKDVPGWAIEIKKDRVTNMQDEEKRIIVSKYLSKNLKNSGFKCSVSKVHQEWSYTRKFADGSYDNICLQDFDPQITLSMKTRSGVYINLGHITYQGKVLFVHEKLSYSDIMSFEKLISTIANFIVCNYDQISMKIVHDRMRMPSVDLDEIIGGIPFENEVDIVPGDLDLVKCGGLDEQRDILSTEDFKELSHEELLKKAGFVLVKKENEDYWELILKDDEQKQKAAYRAFSGGEEDEYVDDLHFLCKKDFSKCLLFYDADVFSMPVEEYMEYVRCYLQEIL